MGKKVTRALVILSIVGFAMVSVSSSVAAQAMANQDTNSNPKKQNDSTAVANPKGGAQTPASEQTDLTGTYTGTFDCEAAGVSGETTLTINGNQFTTADGKSGRIVATTTSGYTAVAMQIGELAAPAAGQVATAAPTVISLRAQKKGSRLVLTSLPGTTQKCSFTPTRAAAASRRTRSTPAAASVPAATGTAVSSPTEAVPESSAGPMPPATPTKKGARGTKSSRAKATPANVDTNINTGAAPSIPSSNPRQDPIPTPTPTPNPSPTPTPSPSPDPSPGPSPVPSPSPSPTPTPTPRAGIAG